MDMSETPSTSREELPGAGGSRRSPRQARSAETRRRLLDAGFEAFAAKGFDGVNLVDDVLEPAGISIGSFYHQFADKAELLREILAEAASRRRRFIVQLGELDPASDLETTVRQVIERLYDSLERDAVAWRMQRASRIAGADGVRDLGSAARENWNDAVAELLGRWFDHPTAELRRAGDPVVTLARGFVYDFLDTPARQRRGRREQVDDLVSFVVGGLTAVLGPPRATPRADA
jgi:AcrR family transcriptional regulator